MGGHPGSGGTANSEQWNGSSWTEVANLGTARYSGGGTSAGTASSYAIVSGGHPPRLVNTEEWTEAASVETVAFD